MLDPLSDSDWSRRTADHLLSRTGFGGSPAEREALYQLGLSQGVAAAVNSIVDQAEDWTSFPLPAWAQNFNNGDDQGFPDHYRETQFVGWYVDQMRNAAPLAAKMFKFYVDHFPVDTRTFDIAGVDFIYLFKHFGVLRDHAVGNFGDLARAVSRSEAMMSMLDLNQSRRGAINENFGRELLELFTVGVDGGYNEQDVGAVAAAFTGRMFRVDPPYENFQFEGYLNEELGYWDEETQTWYADEYRFIDMTEKAVFGVTIPALVTGAEPKQQGDQVIEVILGRFECARHLCWKLWRYFVEPDPSEALLDDLAVRLRDTHQYEVREVLRVMFMSEEFYAGDVIGSQIKDPVDLVVGTTKMLEAPLPGNATVAEILEELGHVIYQPPNIAGWPEPIRDGNGWLSTGAMMFRLNLPVIWTHGEIGVLQRPWRIPGENEAAPWTPEHPFPEFVDLEVVAPKELRGVENLDLYLETLASRLLPLHGLRAHHKRALLDHHARTRAGHGEEAVLRELIRQVLSLPESQLQ